VTTLLAFAFVLGVLVFVHELGHFMAARWNGVRVLTFSIGFGPRIFGFRRGDTEYVLSIIPLGGFVKMAGESPDDPRAGQPDEFMSKSKWQRFQILIMGPAMNLLLAVVVMAVVLMQGASTPSYLRKPALVGVVNAESPAAVAGVRPGDLITRLGSAEVATWEQLELAVAARPEADVDIVVIRDRQEVRLPIRPATTRVGPGESPQFEVGTIGVLPDVYPVIRDVISGQPAAAAGLQANDTILSINGRRMVFGAQVSEAIAGTADGPVRVEVERAGARQLIEVTPVKEGDRPRIGISIGDAVETFTPTPLQAVGLSVQRNIEMSATILRTLRDLFTGEASPKQLMGPVGIAQLSGETAKAGWVALLGLMVTLSLNLGLLNLLPIPVLDGGHIFIMALETIARRDFSVEVKEKLHLAGFAVLMTLMVTVIYNDLTRIAWLERLMFWR
jgi:regulator of sigma E protease